MVDNKLDGLLLNDVIELYVNDDITFSELKEYMSNNGFKFGEDVDLNKIHQAHCYKRYIKKL